MHVLTLKRHNSFQNENNSKAAHSFHPRPLVFKLYQKFLKLNDSATVGATPKLTW